MLNSLFYTYNRLCHFIMAKPIDILHSPFVFKLYQDASALERNQLINHNFIALIQKTRFRQPNAIAGLLTALNAQHLFQLQCVQETWYLTSINNDANKFTVEEMRQQKQPIDGIFVADNSPLNNLPLNSLKSLLNSQCPLIVNKPHANAITHQQWHELYPKNEIQIAIDFFDFGCYFFNRKQAKEYFKLRLW